MPLYQFRCAQCGPFDAAHPMTSVPDAADCPDCGEVSRRQITVPRLGRGSSTAMHLLDATARSAHEPAVVTGARPGTRHTIQKVTTDPLHRKLPRP
nr:zinc ribbon domain-containing protein [Prescottella subtropica]